MFSTFGPQYTVYVEKALLNLVVPWCIYKNPDSGAEGGTKFRQTTDKGFVFPILMPLSLLILVP